MMAQTGGTGDEDDIRWISDVGSSVLGCNRSANFLLSQNVIGMAQEMPFFVTGGMV